MQLLRLSRNLVSDISLQADAFRGHGLSRFVAVAPAGSSARIVPAGKVLAESDSVNAFATKQRSDAGAHVCPSPPFASFSSYP
ncbi:hypothetical protein EEX84_08690 [Planococcus salinus]|uniref:Uncharacterized protein n=1 Tax=Planococcus salinus TaxID=1848460 RepID=A0A3M8P7E7_9BACL|nr:hypothetical protein EEX84_08690 [Planococcus salinus]